jgi:hypothetical protein
MTLLTAQSVVAAGTTPTPITPTASDTISVNDLIRGALLRVITTGTSTNVTVLDPGSTPSSNPGSPTAVACPATGIRMVYVPPSAASTAGLATITASGALTGVTYELYRL